MLNPTPNLPLLRQVLKHIDTHPDQWYQRWWALKTDCGTACCIAGWACILSGFTMDWNAWNARGTYLTTGTTVPLQAKESLELTQEEARLLFSSTNTREDIEHLANQIAERAGEPLWGEPSDDSDDSEEEFAPCLEDKLITV